MNNMSSVSFCDFEEFVPDRSLLNGYQSVVKVWKEFLDEKKVQVLTSTRVNKIR